MHPFLGKGQRRMIVPEICEAVAAATGSTLVEGFAEMLDVGDAVIGGDRAASYAEIPDRRRWLLRLSASGAMKWKTAVVPPGNLPLVSFFLNVGFGNGSPMPQPSGRWDISINGRFVLSVRMVNHSQLWRENDCSFAFAASRIETAEPQSGMCLSSIITDESLAAFGPAFLTVPVSWLEPGQPAVIELTPVAEQSSTRWFQLAPTAPGLLQRTDIWQVVSLLNEESRRFGEHSIFFGDIHTHSGQVRDECLNKGCGVGSREDNYHFARGAGALDFYSLTDHELQIDPQKADEYLGLADKYNEDGRFVCVPGFEYTNLLYGHRNIYFRSGGGTVFSSNKEWGSHTLDPEKCNTPQDMWAAMEATGVPFITVPHHTSAASHPTNLDIYNPKYDRLFEVYSCWGSSEYYGDYPRGVSDRFRNGDFRDAIMRGQRYGLIASSDGHDGHPGDAQSPFFRHHHIFHYCGSGRAAVLTTELTCSAVFDALHARRCYATTGVPILLDVRVNGAVMGSELPALPTGVVPQIKISCRGANGLKEIRIVKNARVVHLQSCFCEWSYDIEWEDREYDASVPNSYYVRVVQVDRESAWSSPVWIG